MTDGEQAKLRKKLYNKKWNAENRDKVNAAARKLYVKNAEKDREDSRKYYAANKERRDEYSKRWCAQNPEKMKAYKRKSNRKRNGVADATGESRTGVCPLCQRVRKLVLDHDHETGAWRGWLCLRCNVQFEWFLNNKAAIIAYESGALRFVVGLDSSVLPGVIAS